MEKEKTFGVTLELSNAVAAVRASLAAAFGGYSQYSHTEIAKAISGHGRNGGSLSAFAVDELIQAFSSQEGSHWDDCTDKDAEEAAIRAAMSS